MASDEQTSKRVRAAAIVLAATGVFWIIVTRVGTSLDWTQRIRALFDLIALAGFGLGLWMAFQAWRARQND